MLDAHIQVKLLADCRRAGSAAGHSRSISLTGFTDRLLITLFLLLEGSYALECG
jgi:hypothetical protein